MAALSRAPTATALLLCVVSSVLYFLTFLDFDLFPLIWFCFVPVLFAIRDATPKRTLWLGTVFGTVTNAGGYYWVVHTIQAFGNMHVTVAVLGYVLLCMYQGFLLAIVLALVRYGQRRLGIAPVWSLPVVFAALEVAYPLLFPSYIGNSQLEFTTITQFVDVTGMAGLTVLIGLVNGGLYELLDARTRRRPLRPMRLALPAAAFLTCATYGLIRVPQIEQRVASARPLTVAIVQTNIGARDKAADPNEFVLRHRAMTHDVIAANPEVQLVIWPESAYNQLIERSQANVKDDVMRDIDRPLLFGALTYGAGPGGRRSELFNSLLLADRDGRIASRYDKVELLAFGETYPLSGTFPFLESVFGSNWFTRGTELQPLQLGAHSLLPMICFEDILPSLVRRLWNEGGPADVLVNGTNDSWYGNTHEPMIHLALASFRSIETRRALIRSTNTGISAIVDPLGRITHRTGQWTRESLVARVPMIEDRSTTIFMRFGDVVGWTCLVLVLGGFGLARRKSSS